MPHYDVIAHHIVSHRYNATLHVALTHIHNFFDVYVKSRLGKGKKREKLAETEFVLLYHWICV